MEIKIDLKNCTINHGKDTYSMMKAILQQEEFRKQYDKKKEHFWVIALNDANQIVHVELVALGGGNIVYVQPVDVVKISLLKDAKSIIFVHNHPSGRPEPSELDKDLTSRLIHACKIIGVRVQDHVIITENSYYSFASSGLLLMLKDNMKYMASYELEKIFHEELEEKVQMLELESDKKIQAGLKKWWDQGKEEEKVATAKRMLSLSLDRSLIVESTRLSVEEVDKLAKN